MIEKKSNLERRKRLTDWICLWLPVMTDQVTTSGRYSSIFFSQRASGRKTARISCPASFTARERYIGPSISWGRTRLM